MAHCAGRAAFVNAAPAAAMTGARGAAGPRGYAICTMGRSGSTWFMALLASTGALGRPCEAFNTPVQRGSLGPDYPADRAAQARYVLERCSTPNGVYGVKMTPPLLTRLGPRLRWTEALPGLRFVQWRRRDLLGQALSRCRAMQTEQWFSTDRAQGEARYDGAAILFELRRGALFYARWEMFFARNGLQPLRLDYEDALRDPQGAADAVAALVGLAGCPAVDPSGIALTVQRDATTERWRARFLDEFGDPDSMDEF